MQKRRDWRQATLRRHVEVAAILLFAAFSVTVLLLSGYGANPQAVAMRQDPQLSAQASAMPNQGWAPLTVYFSAYGSQSQDDSSLRYEWDLDDNGALDYDATRQGGYASYTYSKPGDYTIRLQVTDSHGNSGEDWIKVRVRLRASSSVDYWTIFDDTRVRRIEIRLSQSDWDQMWMDPEAKYQARADAMIFGEQLHDIGFRMRGQFSLRESGAKKPWKIDTDAYVDAQEYHNLRQLMLLNNIGDPSMLKEKLAYEMMAFAGLPASHVAYIELWIDLIDDSEPPIYWGIYSLVERVDNKYLANRFGQDSKGGNLYKASHAQRGPMDLKYYGDDIQDYPTQNGQYAYGKMNNEAEADYGDIVQLCRTVDGTQYPSDEAFMQAIEAAINVDAFLRYIAVVTILDNWDSYPYTGNNYYLFNNEVNGRFEWIPWDLTWGGNPKTPILGRADPGLIGEAPLYDNVFRVEAYRRQYFAYVDLLLRYWFNPVNITQKAQAYHHMISPYITQSTGDTAFYGARPMFPPEAFTNSWQELIDFTNQRHAFLVAQLQQGWP